MPFACHRSIFEKIGNVDANHSRKFWRVHGDVPYDSLVAVQFTECPGFGVPPILAGY
jgi:hypothetical protein